MSAPSLTCEVPLLEEDSPRLPLQDCIFFLLSFRVVPRKYSSSHGEKKGGRYREIPSNGCRVYRIKYKMRVPGLVCEYRRTVCAFMGTLSFPHEIGSQCTRYHRHWNNLTMIFFHTKKSGTQFCAISIFFVLYHSQHHFFRSRSIILSDTHILSVGKLYTHCLVYVTSCHPSVTSERSRNLHFLI